MAKAAATAPDTDDEDAGAADAGSADTGDSGDDEQSQPEVIATILCYPDGSYGLTQGDEDEDEAGGEAEGGEEPQRFGSIGELLHGVMQTVKDYESEKTGEGSEAENFAAGYSGNDMTTQSKMGAGT